MRLRTNALCSCPALTVFLALVLVQGFHELEHIVQVVQHFALGIPSASTAVAAGELGTPFQSERAKSPARSMSDGGISTA